MSGTLVILYAAIAAIGNALFALGQRQAAGAANGMLFVAASAFVACLLAFLAGAAGGALDAGAMLRAHGRSVALSGAGLFLTYLGFNLLYTRFGAAPYVVYAALAIVTTTVGIGFLYLREPVNRFHVAAVVLAVAAIGLYALGQSRT